MKKNKIMGILLASILLLASCHKDTIQLNTKAAEYFPNSIGDYWEYNVHDSTAGYTQVQNYTVKVTIVGVKKLVDGIDAYVWQYEYPSGNDTNYVRIVGDTVKIYDPFRVQTIRGLEFPLEIYIVPFASEQRWDGKLLVTDTFHIYTAPSVKTQAGTFTNCFNIYHHYLGPNTEYRDNYWFKPSLGMIKMYFNRYALNPTTFRTWNLNKYYLH